MLNVKMIRGPIKFSTYECQYFDEMDLWNYIWASVTNQMPTLIMKGNDNQGNQESIQFSHVNFAPPNGTKQRVKKNSILI